MRAFIYLSFSIRPCRVFSFALMSAQKSQRSSEEPMDTSGVEKFFTLWPEDGQEKGEKPKVHITVRKEPYKLRISCQESFKGHFSASVFSTWCVSGC